MLKFAALVIAVCLAGLALADEYVVKNMRASKLLGLVTGIRPGPDRFGGTASVFLANGGSSLIPEGVTVKAEDPAGKLLIDGPKEKVEELLKYLQTFDVRPMMIRVSMELSCAADKYAGSSTFDVPSNSSHGISDGVLGVEISVSPRINQDGTITAYLAVDQGKKSLQTVVRCKQGAEQVVTIEGKYLDDRGRTLDREPRAQPVSPEAVVIRIRMVVSENSHRPR